MLRGRPRASMGCKDWAPKGVVWGGRACPTKGGVGPHMGWSGFECGALKHLKTNTLNSRLTQVKNGDAKMGLKKGVVRDGRACPTDRKPIQEWRCKDGSQKGCGLRWEGVSNR